MGTQTKQLSREELEKKKLGEILKEFEALKGSMKNIKRPTKEEREKWALEFIEKKRKGLNLLRKYGLD